MSAFFEIAYAAASHQLCLFTGTGFSKAVSENSAPSWKNLLEMMCDELVAPAPIKAALFPVGGGPLSLEESAQVISIELSKCGKNIHQEIAKKIGLIKLSGDNSKISSFFKGNSIQVVTTNYDKLAEQLANPNEFHSITPGLPIPRSQGKVKVYHIHGSIDSPSNMVVTSDDYFRFINSESYFSRKLSTLLHENTVVILGYSLGDTNLKAIISDYKVFSRDHVIGGNIFLISKSKIDQHIKDYYAHCYGIRVLDLLEIQDFFEKVANEIPEAKKCAIMSVDSIKNVLFNNHEYLDNFLKIESSFFKIVASVAAIGRSINDQLVVTALEKIIRRKIKLTGDNGAWLQYEHLAQWLIYLGSILELTGTSLQDTYLEAVLKSMNSMSKTKYFGYSWHAYEAWNQKWSDVIASNRALIKMHIEGHTADSDALEIVERG
jgi:SIR2-like domain